MTALQDPVKTFPQKLMDLIDEKRTDESIQWIPSGKAFIIITETFSNNIMDKYFQGSKFDSFTRRLYRYGFRKVMEDVYPSSVMAFRHKLFQRGRTDLLKYVTGGRKKAIDPAVLESLDGGSSVGSPPSNTSVALPETQPQSVQNVNNRMFMMSSMLPGVNSMNRLAAANGIPKPITIPNVNMIPMNPGISSTLTSAANANTHGLSDLRMALTGNLAGGPNAGHLSPQVSSPLQQSRLALLRQNIDNEVRARAILEQGTVLPSEVSRLRVLQLLRQRQSGNPYLFH